MYKSKDLFHIDLYREVFEFVDIGKPTYMLLHFNYQIFLHHIQSISYIFSRFLLWKAVYKRLSKDLFHIDLYREVFGYVVTSELTHILLYINNLTFLHNIQSISYIFSMFLSWKAVYKD